MKISKNAYALSILLATGLLIVGCATDAGKKLDQKLSQEPEISNATVLSQKVQSSIDLDKNLSPDQKVKLSKLREDTSAELRSLRRQSLKLRDLLVKDFVAENDQEIDLIHDRLETVNNRQVSVIFDAVKKADVIVGHTPRNREWFNEMMMEDRGHNE